MIWGINTKKYLADGNRCKFYGDKQCPCIIDKEIRKRYDKKNGCWATGNALPECDGCEQYVEIDPKTPIAMTFDNLNKTLIEREIALAQYREGQEKRKEVNKTEKAKKTTPIRVELINATGGTAGERLSKTIIGGALFGGIGAIAGMLGSDASNVKLIFKVGYADGHTETVVEKANSKDAKRLLRMIHKE